MINNRILLILLWTFGVVNNVVLAQVSQIVITDTVEFNDSGALWITDYSKEGCSYLGFDFFSKDIKIFSSDGEEMKSFPSNNPIGSLAEILGLSFINDSIIVVSGLKGINFFDLNGNLLSDYRDRSPGQLFTTLSKKLEVHTSNDAYCIFRTGSFHDHRMRPDEFDFYENSNIVQEDCFNKKDFQHRKTEYALNYPANSLFIKKPGIYPRISFEMITGKGNLVMAFPYDSKLFQISENLEEIVVSDIDLEFMKDDFIKYQKFGKADAELKYRHEQLNPSIRKVFYDNNEDIYILQYQKGLDKHEIVSQRAYSSSSYAKRRHFISVLDGNMKKIGKELELPPSIKDIIYVHNKDRILCKYFSPDDPETEDKYFLISIR